MLICSCDKYSDAWDICAKSIEKFWPDCDYDVLLLTETKYPNVDSIIDKTIHVKSTNWASMLHEALEYIDYEYVIFMLEDQWSVKSINQKCIDDAMTYMENNTDVAIVYFETSKENGVRKTETLDERFNSILFGSPYRICCAPGIFRKNFLYELTSMPISPWDFERILSFDERGAGVQVLELKNTNWTRIDETGAIYRGKWVPEIKKYAEEIGIELDYSIRGVQSWKDMAKRKAKDFIFNLNPSLIVRIQKRLL